MKRLIALMMCAVSLGAAAQLPDYVPTDGLVGWFPCDSSLLDLTGTYTAEEVAFDGFLEGVYGDTNGALGFDGESDFIRFEGNPVFGDSFSIGLWIKTEFGEHGSIVHVGRDDGGNEFNGFGLGIGEGGMNTPGDYLMAHFPGVGYFDVSSSVPNESWQHVCITKGSQVMTFYVQGESVGSLSTTSNFHNPSSKLYLAAFSETVYEKYGGALDEIGLWNRVLSPAEVNQLFTRNLLEGCTESEACNYAPEANVDDGSCELFTCKCLEGTVWSEELGGCVVANPADINLDGCVQLNDLLDLLSAYGDCGAEELGWQCGDPLEYQGYDYETVQIGEQCWFAENLMAQNYRDGLPISEVNDCPTWSGITEGAYCSYENQTDHSNVHGLLYNWFVTDDALGVCPSGWHVPTDSQWMALEIEIGMSESAANGTFLRGTTEGDELKSATTWNGMDAHGFNSLPSGWRAPNNGCDFVSSNESTYYWSSTPSGSLAIGRGLTSVESGIWRMTTYQLRNGFSVRCIKDTE